MLAKTDLSRSWKIEDSEALYQRGEPYSINAAGHITVLRVIAVARWIYLN